MKNFSVNLKGQPAKEIQAEALPGIARFKLLEAKGLDRAVAAKVNGQNRDLSALLEEKAELEPIDADSPEGLEILRHSTSHVMAMAVKDLIPGVKVTIGPAIGSGFYELKAAASKRGRARPRSKQAGGRKTGAARR